MISIVIPTYREGVDLFEFLEKVYQACQSAELIVVDASDVVEFETLKTRAEKSLGSANLRVVTADQKGRACQMNQGARMTSGATILFLHADTYLPKGAMDIIQKGIDTGSHWGRFNVQFANKRWPYRLIAAMMNLRSCSTGIATGDQAIFMTRTTFDLAGGFDEIPLMEDIEMSKKLKRIGRPLCVNAKVLTSARRWERKGVLKTILLMWWLRLANWMGVSPKTLESWYR